MVATPATRYGSPARPGDEANTLAIALNSHRVRAPVGRSRQAECASTIETEKPNAVDSQRFIISSRAAVALGGVYSGGFESYFGCEVQKLSNYLFSNGGSTLTRYSATDDTANCTDD
jgi:hypothetical protein